MKLKKKKEKKEKKKEKIEEEIFRFEKNLISSSLDKNSCLVL